MNPIVHALTHPRVVGWSKMNQHVQTLTEEELSFILQLELQGRRNRAMLQRLHQRLSRLRTNREWKEIEDARISNPKTPEKPPSEGGGL